MKTTILTIAIALSTVLGFSKPISAATGSNQQVSTVLTEVSKINQIEIHGNVELYLSGGSADQVKVYNSYYAESALVQDDKGILRISSYTPQKLVVWVTASDLSSLSVYDNAEVKSFGKISAIGLDVKLFNNAAAKLDIDAYKASITLTDRAKADITGSADEAFLKYDQSSTLNTADLAAVHLFKTVNRPSLVSNDIADLAAL